MQTILGISSISSLPSKLNDHPQIRYQELLTAAKQWSEYSCYLLSWDFIQ
jgi:hypothetical protein